MRFRTGVIAAAALALAPTITRAAAPRPGAPTDWAITPDAAVSAPVRIAAMYAWNQPLRPAAWQRFITAAPGRWFASWDRATAVPNRIFGEGIRVFGSVADPAIAEQFARAFLADHLDLLAPGAAAGDFTLVSNTSDGDIRSIGFVQSKHGLRVVGGQVAFEFKRDRLFVIHSEALPDVAVPPFALLAPRSLADRARDLTIAATGVPTATAGAPGPVEILPLVGDDRVLGYRAVAPVDVDAGALGRWTVYADASSGTPIARHQELEYTNGTVDYDAVVRWRGRPRQQTPARRMHAQVDGGAGTSDDSGVVSWSAASSVPITATTDGDLVHVVNDVANTQQFPTTIAPGGTVLWSQAASSDLDAELNAFVHVQIVNAYVRAIDPDLPYLNVQVVADVDIQQTCNAFYSGDRVNFFHEGASPGGGMCSNTATIADVVYHEFEHGVHEHEIVPGVGQFDGSLSEGQSDFIAASITGDSGMGRGFDETDKPLRELDPPDSEAKWPDNVGEIHMQGLIFAGAMWDLRKALIAQMGEPAGVALTNKLFLGAIRRSSTIPTTIVEILATDDDNGNLADGTPHECAILGAFGPHGLRAWSVNTTQPGSIVAGTGQTSIEIDTDLVGLSPRCPADTIQTIKLKWTPQTGSVPAAGSVDMTAGVDAAHWSAMAPMPPDGARLSYQIAITFADGSDMLLPDNLVDPYYTLYQGPTVPLYCTTLDTDPFADGWTHKRLEGNDDWTWAAPVASESGDPGAAHTGTMILGTTVGGDGTYSPSTDELLISPTIDFGKYSDVHLQYWRHLAVQDGQNDQANVIANTETAWTTPAQPMGSGRQFHFVDNEWIFDDVPLSGHVVNGTKVAVTFELHSDGGYQLGGWNLDDLCIVANANAFCGDGVKQGTEQCDTGSANADVADTCRTYCRLPACGDSILDSKEACDDGNKTDGDGCSSKCVIEPPKDTGCCEAGGAPAGGSFVLALGVLLLRRRRR